ncbi:MAG: C4-type zinc ribbon domain-containing protein [Candidatus Glassbacteria bacterium]
MSNNLDKLIILHDLWVMKREFENEETASKYKEIGFEINQVEMIQEAIDELMKKIDPSVLKMYMRIATKYERPIVPTKDGICYGCFVAMPTAEATSLFKDTDIAKCSNCGRLLYLLK